mgnify:CR=1 FL=1
MTDAALEGQADATTPAHRLRGPEQWVLGLLAILGMALAVNQLFNLQLFAGVVFLDNRYLFLLAACFLSAAFIAFPGWRRTRPGVPLLDWALAALTLATTGWLAWNAQNIVAEGWEYAAPPVAIGMAVLLWALVLEALRRSGGTVIFWIVLVASLCALVLVVAVVAGLVLLRPTPDSQTAQGPDTTAPAATGEPTPTLPPAPTGLRILEDSGGSATLTWIDPSDGQVPFIVSAGRQGDALIAISTVPAGETTTTIYGLNINYDYCFTVAAVWSSEHLSESDRTCTQRTAVTPPPA